MNWWPAILIIGGATLVGIVIAFLVRKTFENMEETSECFKQIAKDLIRISELMQEGEQMIALLENWRKQ